MRRVSAVWLSAIGLVMVLCAIPAPSQAQFPSLQVEEAIGRIARDLVTAWGSRGE